VPTWADTTLKVIPQASLRVLDPIWTTAYLTESMEKSLNFSRFVAG
jgi:hypothetical protein